MDDVEKCRKCGAKYPQGGDGYDGLCPSCADKATKRTVVPCDSCHAYTLDTGAVGEKCSNCGQEVTQ